MYLYVLLIHVHKVNIIAFGHFHMCSNQDLKLASYVHACAWIRSQTETLSFVHVTAIAQPQRGWGNSSDVCG